MSISLAGGEESHYETPAVNSEINMTPFVDIMLVLLIIFMVITPALLQGFQASLPMGDNLLERPEEEEPRRCGYRRRGGVVLQQASDQKGAHAARPRARVR